MLKIDHVAIITPNLATTAWQLHAAGLMSSDGGYNLVQEAGIARAGSAHRDIPLGNDQYIEIEQLIDTRSIDEVSEDLPRFIVGLRDRAVREGALIFNFWLASDEFEGHCRRIGAEPQLHQRLRPDGFMSKARTVPRSMDAVVKGLPTFVEFLIPMEKHPGRERLAHPVAPAGIAWLEIGGDRKRMEDWLGPEADTVPLRYVGGEPWLRGMGVALESGEVIEIRPGGALLDIRRTRPTETRA